MSVQGMKRYGRYKTFHPSHFGHASKKSRERECRTLGFFEDPSTRRYGISILRRLRLRHPSREACDEDCRSAAVRRSDSDDQARRRNYPVVRAEHRCSQPTDSICFVTFAVMVPVLPYVFGHELWSLVTGHWSFGKFYQRQLDLMEFGWKILAAPT